MEAHPRSTWSVPVRYATEIAHHDFTECIGLVIRSRTMWKPWTLRWPVFTAVIAVTMAMGTLLAILQLKNDKHGGIIFADHVSDFSTGSTFLYLYLPTVIAVFYSIGWSWIDLDAKRLEPWFQLSKPEGATSERSLLLQYPIDFLAFVPFRAARTRYDMTLSHAPSTGAMAAPGGLQHRVGSLFIARRLE